MGFVSKPRVVWQSSPDTEEIRQHLLDLLESMQAATDEDRYPFGIGLGETILAQLAEFKEQRAVPGLERIVEHGPETLAEISNAALAAIRRSR